VNLTTSGLREFNQRLKILIPGKSLLTLIMHYIISLKAVNKPVTILEDTTGFFCHDLPSNYLVHKLLVVNYQLIIYIAQNIFNDLLMIY
jgi:hypothetical protein